MCPTFDVEKALLMRLKHFFRRIFIPLSLFFSAGITGAVASACAAVDSGYFRELSSAQAQSNTGYADLSVQRESVKNLIYGTNAYNNGNYVLLIYTINDSTQTEFVFGTKQPSTQLTYNSEWGRAVQKYGNPAVPAGDVTLYPDAIRFAMFGDNTINESNFNPYSKWKTLQKDSPEWQEASPEEQANSGQFRRNDPDAISYREIVDFILKTYSTDSTVQGWYSATNATVDSGNVQTQQPVTSAMILAFKNTNGVISHSFYNASSQSTPTNPDDTTTGTDTGTGTGTDTGSGTGTGTGTGTDTGTTTTGGGNTSTNTGNGGTTTTTGSTGTNTTSSTTNNAATQAASYRVVHQVAVATAFDNFLKGFYGIG